MRKLFTAACLATLVAGCAGGPGGGSPYMSRDRIERVLAGAPGQAQPSEIVAAEIAFARAARENGQWTAFREFLAPGALLHVRSGPIEADPWLAAQADPPEAVQWGARSVWMSCDGALAVSQGRFREPDGTVGTFVTVWQREDADDDYRWIYDVGAPDDPQPPPRSATAGESEDEIVVTGRGSIQGRVADCPGRGEAVPPPPALAAVDGARSDAMLSRDGTLRWRWEHGARGQRRVVAEYFHEGAWQIALDQVFPATAG